MCYLRHLDLNEIQVDSNWIFLWALGSFLSPAKRDFAEFQAIKGRADKREVLLLDRVLFKAKCANVLDRLTDQASHGENGPHDAACLRQQRQWTIGGI